MPINRIAVGTDFAAPAEIAVKEALGIARRNDAEVVLVHVAHAPDPAAAIPPGLRYVADDYALQLKKTFLASEERLVEWKRAFPNAKISQKSCTGHPVDELPKAAEALRADLLVVGTHGHTGVRRFLLGSVAERIVRLFDGYVMVGRGTGDGEGGYHRVLVPVDFSEYTEPAVEKALEMASADSEIELCHFWQLPGIMSSLEASGETWPQLRTGIIDVLAQQGQALVDKYASSHPGRMLFHTYEAKPAAGIHDRIDEGKFDLVVMGSHGRRGLSRWALGSVAELSVRHAPCSILISHRAHRHGDAHRFAPVPGL